MKTELSDGEWVLMNQLWTEAPRTITQLTAALKEDAGWSKHTIISMLSRLEAKGAVGYRDNGRAKAYFRCSSAATPPGGRPGTFWTRSTGAAWG